MIEKRDTPAVQIGTMRPDTMDVAVPTIAAAPSSPPPAPKSARPVNLRTSWGGSSKRAPAADAASSGSGGGGESTSSHSRQGRGHSTRRSAPGAPAPQRRMMPKSSGSASRLTQPKTPEMMKRGRRSSVKRVKTSEELELEKIKALRDSFHKKRKLSANSFKKVCTRLRAVETFIFSRPSTLHIAMNSCSYGHFSTG